VPKTVKLLVREVFKGVVAYPFGDGIANQARLVNNVNVGTR